MNSAPERTRRFSALWPAIAASLLAIVLYACTAAPDLTWAHDGADGGDLITATALWGIPHPSGYPTYTILGHLFGLLPLGNAARRINLFSATAASASTFFMVLISWRVTHRIDHQKVRSLIALTMGLIWATSHTLWSQAIISEVYGLQALFTTAMLYLAIRSEAQLSWRESAILGFVAGLGLGSHLTTILLWPGLLIMIWPKLDKKAASVLLLAIALGASIYAYLPLAAHQQPLLNWGGTTTWQGFWWMISGRMYQGYALALPLNYLPNRLAAMVHLWAKQYSIAGIALALLGIESLWGTKRKRLLAGTALAFGPVSLYALTYNTADSYVYMIPAYAISVLWLTQGSVALIVTLLSLSQKERIRARLSTLSITILLAILIWSIANNIISLSLRHDRKAVDWLESVSCTAPQGALLITSQDRHTFALDYMLWVKRNRTDLIVVDADLYGFTWYQEQLARRYPDQTFPLQPASLERLIDTHLPHRAVLLCSEQPELDARFLMRQEGLFWQVTGARDTSDARTHRPLRPLPKPLSPHRDL